MSWIVSIFAGLLGLCVSVQLVAAVFGIRDLWYDVHRHAMRILVRIGFWLGLVVVMTWILGNYGRAFLLGILVFIGGLPVIFWIGKIINHRPEPKPVDYSDNDNGNEKWKKPV